MRLEKTLNNQGKAITSLKVELNGAHSTEEACKSKLEQFKEEVYEWKEEVRERDAEVGRLKRRVERFRATICHAAERVT
jgi:predicted RNase H-like nuclease (RuvC/YqgF family)